MQVGTKEDGTYRNLRGNEEMAMMKRNGWKFKVGPELHQEGVGLQRLEGRLNENVPQHAEPLVVGVQRIVRPDEEDSGNDELELDEEDEGCSAKREGT